MQQPFSFALPKVSWTPPDLARLPSWRDAKNVCIDVETYDPELKTYGIGTRRGGYIVGIAFAIEDGPAEYLPIRHQGGDNLDPDKVLAYMRDQAACFTGEITGAQLQYEYDYLEEAGVHFRPKAWRDVLNAEPLLDEHQYSYKLDQVLTRWNMPNKVEGVLRDAIWAFGLDEKNPKGELFKLPARYVRDYGIGDVRLPLELRRRQERKIDEEELWGAWDLETQVLPILARIRRRGIPVNMDKVDRLDRQAAKAVDKYCTWFSAYAQYKVVADNLDTTEILANALEKLGIKCPKTEKTKKRQVDAALLFKHDHLSAVQALIRAKAWHRLRTFCARTHKYAVYKDGHYRIHPTFNQLRGEDDSIAEGKKRKSKGTRTGRVSGEHPNNQQDPTRDQWFGDEWRSIYECEPGEEWCSLDLSQQEPRWWVHYAAGMKLPQADRWKEEYLSNPYLHFHKRTAQITGIRYELAKNLGLGVGYGMGGGKMCREYLKLPTEWRVSKKSGMTYEAAGPEGQKVLDQYHDGIPWLRMLAWRCQDVAKKRGYIVLRDGDGRRLRFVPRADGDGYIDEKDALNRLTQGRSAVQTKRCLVALDQLGVPLYNTVHDEFNFSHGSRAFMRKAAEVMRDADSPSCGSLVKPGIGPNWGNYDEYRVEDLPMLEAA